MRVQPNRDKQRAGASVTHLDRPGRFPPDPIEGISILDSFLRYGYVEQGNVDLCTSATLFLPSFVCRPALGHSDEADD